MKKIILPLLLSVFLSGCYVQSLYKFYTDDLKIELPQIVGDWTSEILMGEDVSNKKISPWKFTQQNTIETYDKDNRYSELEVVYFRIGDNIFIDFTAGNPLRESRDFCNFFWGAGITLTHSLCKVSIEDNNLIIIPLNIKWFEDRIEKKKLGLSFVKADKDSNYIFTAPTNQWILFLKKYADDQDVFDEEYRFVFKKKEPFDKADIGNG